MGLRESDELLPQRGLVVAQGVGLGAVEQAL
jgi:hypothetical protein